MNNIRLPNDIQAYVSKKRAKRIGACAVFEGLVLLILLFMGERLFSAMGVLLQSIIYVILLLLPPILTGVPFKLIDRPFCGTVKQVNIKTKTEYQLNHHVRTQTRIHAVNVVSLMIEAPDGTVFEKEATVHSAQLKPEHYLNEFQIGDFVYHFSGTPYLLTVGHDRERASCVICGQESPVDRTHCWNCGHTLIKPQR